MNDWISRLINRYREWRWFITRGVWRIGRPGEPIPEGFAAKQIRVAVLLVQSLVQGQLTIRASALTFNTVLAIVPFLAMMIFIIQSLNLQQTIYNNLQQRWGAHTQAAAQPDTKTAARPPALDTAPPPLGTDPTQIPPAPAAQAGASPERPLVTPTPDEQFYRELIKLVLGDVAQEEETPEGGHLQDPVELLLNFAFQGADPRVFSGAVIIFLLTTVFGLMRNIEAAFNQIWGVTTERSYWRMMSDYLFIILVFPVLVVTALAATTILETRAESLGPSAFAVQGAQLAMLWFVFAAMYRVVPNARVHARHALFGGLIAAILFILTSAAYVKLQIGLANYSVLYAGFAQIPMLLMWVYACWVIVLFGAQISFAYQNEKTFAMERWAQGASHAYREALGIRAMIEMANRFDEGLPPLDIKSAAEAWNVPTRLLSETLDQLRQAGLVTPCATDPPTFQPARSIDRITLGEVVNALRQAGRDPSFLLEDEALRPLLDKIEDARRGALGMSLTDTVAQLRLSDPKIFALEPPPGAQREKESA